MRTKALFVAAALGAASVASSMAQVYSVNAVGYVKLTLQPGFSLIANPLDAGANNTAAGIFADALPEGTQLYKWNGTGYDINTYDPLFGGWTAMDLPPGQGFWVSLPGTAAAEVTFVGEVMQGSLQNPLPQGFSIKASQVPQAGLISTDLGFPGADGDQLYFWNGTGYDIATYDSLFGGWSPEPTVTVGQAFWVSTPAAKSWDRSFSVNQ
jgi:hypothetical protein